MSLLVANHKSIGRAYMSSQVIGSTVFNYTSVTSVVVTPGSTPVSGELMIITIGGSQIRGITQPAGWTLISRVSTFGTAGMMYKFATGSEPANYTVTFTGGALSGGAAYFQLTDVDPDAPTGASIGANSVGSVTTLNVGSFAVLRPGIAITIIAKSASGGGWTTDNGFTPVIAAGQHKYAWKNYLIPDASETVNWSGPVAETIGVDLVVFHSRYVK